MRDAVRRLGVSLVCLAVGLCARPATASPRFLAREQIVLYGLGLVAEPAKQTVPKDIATIVTTYVRTPNLEGAQIPPLPPDAQVLATLRGPSFETPREFAVAPNEPFPIPPLTVAGLHTLDNIRLVAGGEVLFYASPECVGIEVIEKLLITQITARPLTADEIREKGIVYDASNFQAYSFTAAFALNAGPEIKINLPVLLPKLAPAPSMAEVEGVTVPGLSQPSLPSLSTIIPDSLRMMQTEIPNLSVRGFSLHPEEQVGQEFLLPPIPGVVVIPGDIGFLNQYFSVLLMVGNAAPAGSGLVVQDLSAQIVLPAGRDTVAGTSDDPLRMAQTQTGEAPRMRPVARPGPDGKLGTADDVSELAPGESGNAEFLVEGRREGSHVLEMEITATLVGLPIGPVTVRGRAAGSVLVRNPTFTLTFTHPEIVNAGEPYTLDVTITNTSESPANVVSLNLYPRHTSGAAVVGEASRQVDSIPPGDSATVSFDLVSRVNGKVFASMLDSDENVKGSFQLKTSVGELGVPLSPDSLVLPKEASALAPDLRKAVLGLLGKAYAVATAPAAALPPDVRRFTKKVVWDKAIQAAEAGMRLGLHEAVDDNALQLWMDFLGSDVGRLAELYPKIEERQRVAADLAAFDELRRRSVRGDVLAAAVAGTLDDTLAAGDASGFHEQLARAVRYRPSQLSVLVAGEGGSLPVAMTLVDGQGRATGGAGADGKILKEIPFSDHLALRAADGSTQGEMAIAAAPEPGDFTVRLELPPGVSADAPFTVSLVFPGADGEVRHLVFTGVTALAPPLVSVAPGAPYRLALEVFSGGEVRPALDLPPAIDRHVPDLPPSVVSVVQQEWADAVSCKGGEPQPVGRVVAALLSEDVAADSVDDRLRTDAISHFSADGNRVVGTSLQPGRRVVFIALRDPVGPFVPRSITFAGLTDLRGNSAAEQTVPIESTIQAEGGVVSGQVMEADGTAVPGVDMRLFYVMICDEDELIVGVSQKRTDEDGRYGWDFVRRGMGTVVLNAVHPETGEFRAPKFTLARHGQRLNVSVVFLGRGTIAGRVFAEDGVTPLNGAVVRATSLTDQSSYGAASDVDGRFVLARVPVGNVIVEAVHVASRSTLTQSTYIDAAGETVALELVLLSEGSAQDLAIAYGGLDGHVLRIDGATAVPGVPVVVWYQNGSQAGVYCPRLPGSDPPPECPVAIATTDDSGAYTFARVVAGAHRLSTFDQAEFQEGNAAVILAPDAHESVNILLSGGYGSVSGRVVDAAGNPVPGAQVGGGLSLATTDESGNYLLTDVPLGRREIVAAAQTLFAKGSALVDLVTDGERLENVTVVLEGQGSVFGAVTDAGGTPVADLEVFLLIMGLEPRVVVSAVTGADGRYRMDHVPVVGGADTYTLSAFLPDLSDGNVRTGVAVRAQGQMVKADVAFRGRGRVTGAVLDENDNPLAARVSVSAASVTTARGDGRSIGIGFGFTQHLRIVDVPAESGSFTFENVFTGAFVVTAGGVFSPDPVTFAGEIPTAGASVDVTLRLQPTSRVAGVVYLPDGLTPAGKDVIVTFKSNECRMICTGDDCECIPQGIQDETVVTGDDGSFLVPLVNPGKFTLTAEDPVSGKVASATGVVQAGQTADFDLRLVGVADVAVRVLASDGVTPVPGALVKIEQMVFPNAKRNGVADADGRITFAGADAFSEGEFVVTATDVRNGFAGRSSGKVVKDGLTVTLSVHLFDGSGTVYGTVYRQDGRSPVPNAEVIISNQAGALAFAVTDADGAYRQDTIPLGPFWIEVFEAATGRSGRGTGSVDLAGQEVPLNIVEGAVGTVTGYVVAGGTLEPLCGWKVTVNSFLASGRAITLRGTSSTAGAFSFPGVPAGRFTVAVSKAGLGSTASAGGVLVREGDLVEVPIVVNLQKEPRGNIEGLVLNPDGTPAANCHVCYGSECEIATTADETGAFHFDNLALGRYFITASSQVTDDIGSAPVELEFAGEIGFLKIVLQGLGRVTGHVEFDDGSPAVGVEVRLEKETDAGCGALSCTRYSGEGGVFAFTGVPAGRFTVSASEPVQLLRGAAGDVLYPGGETDVRVVLEPSGSVSALILHADGRPAPGVYGMLESPRRKLFAVSGPDGRIVFATVRIDQYTISLEDPLGSGLARAYVQVMGAEELAAITLDEADPAVAALIPAAGTVRVPLDQAVTITFSETVQPGSITTANVTLSGPGGAVPGFVTPVAGYTAAIFTPLQPLAEQAVYTVRVRGLKDALDRSMPRDFVATFTTLDATPPALASVSPAEGYRSGVSIYSVVRVAYVEPIVPEAFASSAISVTSGGQPVDGRVDFAFGNTVVVFTPARPLAEGASYHVEVLAATDLAGNRIPAGLEFEFTSTDRTPPGISSLVASNGGLVIQGAVAAVTAQIGTASDVGLVDFFVNGVRTLVDRSAPYEFSFLAGPALGDPGALVRVSATASDTSGNTGLPAETVFTIVADLPPVVSIAAPAAGSLVAAGERFPVSVQAADDLGLSRLGAQAIGGAPPSSGVAEIAPPSLAESRTFYFTVPAGATPGSVLTVVASATDTRGQSASAEPITLTVRDTIPPTVAFSAGVATGAKVAPGQEVRAVVAAQDPGGVASLLFTVSGGTVHEETRAIAPPLGSVATTFVFTVSPDAGPLDPLTLRAVAVDAAGNSSTPAVVLLPVTDTRGPTVALSPQRGTPLMFPGRDVNVVLEAEDEIGITTVEISGTGAFTWDDARAVSPPLGSARITFAIPVPAGLPEGAVLDLAARARDISGNWGEPAALSLQATSATEVLLPLSALLAAGTSTDLTVSLAGPAPAEGLQVDLASTNTAVATVGPSVSFAPGESERSFTVSGISGGTAQVVASVGGVEASRMTVAVRGGIVRGTVYNPYPIPVSGAEVIVNGVPTTTSPDGTFMVEGIVGLAGRWWGDPGRLVTVKAYDPATKLKGYGEGDMNVINGYITGMSIVLVPAGSVAGTVVQADGVTPAGPDVQVLIFAQDSANVYPATFTDADSAFEFPLLPIGTYVLEAADIDGNRGWSNVYLLQSGQVATATVAFLGKGSVAGVVLDGNGDPVPNASIALSSSSLFGGDSRSLAAGLDGTFRVDDLFMGTFWVSARDPVSGTAAAAAGAIGYHDQEAAVTLRVASWASVEGNVRRFDATTPVAGARVTAGNVSTLTDVSGYYRLEVLPLGSYTVLADDPASRNRGQGSVTLDEHGQVRNLQIVMLGQGSVAVEVMEAGGSPVSDAPVWLSDGYGTMRGLTGPEGLAIFSTVQAGAFGATASAASLGGSAGGTVAAGGTASVTITFGTVQLGAVTGLVLGPDGRSPLSGVSVKLEWFDLVGNWRQISTRTDSDGRYLIDQVQLVDQVRDGAYNLAAYDAAGRLRARNRDVRVDVAGQTVTRDLSFVIMGAVGGRVILPDSSAAAGMQVTVRSHNPEYGRTWSAWTDGGGFYRVEGVPAGAVSVSAGDPSRQLLGEGVGGIAYEGELADIPIILQNNAFSPPLNVWDANRLLYDVQQDGTIAGGGGDVFLQNCEEAAKGAGALTLDAGAGPVPFSGEEIGTREGGGRELVLRQQGIAGLNVSRKVFVPTDGYFARFLEIVANPTTGTVTVDVGVDSRLRCGSTGFEVIATSSGDTVVNSADPVGRDFWAVVDDGIDANPVYQLSPAATAFVWGGPGEATATAEVAHLPRTTDVPPTLSTRWPEVVLAPGESAAFLHFVVQQTGRAAARASAERLVQLPPEALEGLSREELQQVRNFVAPIDGVSALAALPSLTGSVTGHVYEGDGSTRVGGGAVWFRSAHPLFAGEFWMTATAEGAFSLAGSLDELGTSTAVPVFDYTITARHPLTRIVSPTANGAFAPGADTATADIVFTGTGLIAGSVRRHTGVGATSGTVTIDGGSVFGRRSVGIAGDSTFTIHGVPAGTYQLNAMVPNAQGTGLAGAAAVDVVAAGTSDALVVLEATGSVTGTVVAGGGAPVPNLGVRLVRTDFERSTLTDSGGSFTFTDVPLGAFAVSAVEPSSLIVTSADVTVLLDQDAAVELRLVALGAVTAQVSYASGEPASGATVWLQYPVPSSYDESRSGTTDAAGAATFANIPAGPFTITAIHPDNVHLRTAAAGSVPVTGEAVGIAATLPVAGSLEVLVKYATSASAAGAPVTLSYADPSGLPDPVSRSATTDATGHAAFAGVPAGAFTVTALHPVNQAARVTANGAITIDGATVPLTVTLPAVGSVSVQVLRGAGTPVAGSAVRLDQPGLPTISLTSDEDGRAQFTDVPLGTFAIRAFYPASTTLFVTATGAITTADETVPITVTLPVVGTVSVQVLRGAATPVAGSSVRLDQPGQPQVWGTSDGDGRVQFPFVVVGTFSLRADHPANAALFSSAAGALSTEGETVSLSLALPAIGSVTGTVRMPDGAEVAGLAVSLRSSSTAMQTLTTTTDASGVYQVNVVAAGAYTVTAENLEQGVWGTASGQIQVDGALVTSDIQLQTNVVALETNLYDANGMRFDIQQDGGLQHGADFAYDGGLHLALTRGASTMDFAGAAMGTVEETGREVAIRQDGLLGVDVVRKIYVPADGYFARYLEILTNPGDAAVTLNASVRTTIGAWYGTILVATSSGDTSFAPDDHWLVTDDKDTADGSGTKALAHVMGGPGAARQLSSAGLSAFSSLDNLVYAWNDVTIDPRQTVVLMHFAAQNSRQAQVRAGAERLVQLPAEALAGLSPDEISRIVNFAVPPDGSSALPEMRKPGTSGTVAGHVLAGDGLTGVGNAQVTLTSDNVFFGTSRSTTAAADGTFTVTGAMEDSFTMSARHPATTVDSPAVAGTFEGGQTSAAVDITFSNTGVVRGYVRRHAGAAIAGALISLPYSATSGADGSFTLSGLLAGAHTVRVQVDHPQGGTEVADATVTLAAGETVNQDIVLPPTGAISGVVSAASGAPAASVAVRLTNAGGLSRSTTSDALGQFLFIEVPVGLATVWAREPQSNVESSVQATVVQDQTTVTNVTLNGLGTVTGHVAYPDGSAAADSYVWLASFVRSSSTDESGFYQFVDIPVGTEFSVRAYRPGSVTRYVESPPAQLAADGETLTVDVTLPAEATVRVHVKDAAGQPIFNRYVQIMRPDDGEYLSDSGGFTNAEGSVDFASVTEGTARVRSDFPPGGFVEKTVAVTSADHGRTLETTLAAPLPMTVTGTVCAADGTTPLSGISVSVRSSLESTVLQSATTNANGAYSIGTFYSNTADLVVSAGSGSILVEVNVTIPEGETSGTANFVLPVAVVRGRVTYADGTPVATPYVFAEQVDAGGVMQATDTISSDAQGNYAIIGVQPGAFRLTAEGGDRLFTTAEAALVDSATPLTVDLQLPPTGSVTVTFRDAGDVPIAWEDITLWSPHHGSYLSGTTDDQGRVSFPRVAVGAFVVEGPQWYAQIPYSTRDCGEVTGVGESVAVTLKHSSTGTVRARLVDEHGAPVANGSLIVEGILNFLNYSRITDGQGLYQFDGIPEGTIRLTGKASSTYGAVEGVVPAGGILTIDVPLGNAVGFTANLDGADGFRYDVDPLGGLSAGGTTDNSSPNAYGGDTYLLKVSGEEIRRSVASARTELGGRQLVLGPVLPGYPYEAGPPFSVVRRIFVPEAGGFARYLELVTNVSGSVLEATLRVEGIYGPADTDTVVPIKPGDTANTYAVMAPAAAATAPVVGHVFASPGAAIGVARTSVGTGTREFWYEWTVPFAPGETKAILHFAIQRPTDGGVAAVQAQAQALLALTDPLALAGLTTEERGLIVNFAGVAEAQTLGGTVSGAVFAADGMTPVPAVAMYLVDVATGRDLDSAWTTVNGEYALGPVSTTAQGVRVSAVAPPDGATADRLVVFETGNETRTGIDITLPIPVISGTVRQSGGDPLATPLVMLGPVGLAGPTLMATVSRPDGTFAFIGVPVGRFVLTVVDPVSGLSTRAVVDVPTTGSVLSVDLALPTLAVCEPVPADLVSWWPAGDTTADAVLFGNDGTAFGGVSPTAGQIGGAFLFDGTTGRIEVPHRAELDPYTLTLEGWVRFTTLDSPTSSPAADQAIAFKRRGAASAPAREAYSLVKTRTAQGDRFAFRFGQLAGARVEATASTPVEAGVYYHVAGTYDGEFARLYVNGLLEAEVPAPLLREPGVDPLVIGATGLGGAEEGPCACAVDELKLYERALDAAEIQGAYAALAVGTCLDLRLVSAVLPLAFEGQPYPGRVRALGGTAPLTVTLAAGNAATGLVLETDGTFSGLPEAPGSYAFDATLTDALGATETAAFVQTCGGACLEQPSQVVGYFPADDTAADIAGSHHGAMQGGATFAPGVSGSAFHFDGLDDGVGSLTSPLPVQNTFTIEFWANPAATRDTTAEATSGASGLAGQRYAIAPDYRGSNAGASVGVSVGTNGVSVFVAGEVSYWDDWSWQYVQFMYQPSLLVYDAPLADWTHIAVVFQGRQPTLYIDGVPVRSGLVSPWNVSASKTFSGASYGQYAGLLDEVAIYGRALSAAEIDAIFQSRGSARCPAR